ncbi:MAG: hypothetical protein A2785_02580 [Candidatus Chisholmbacteria bacterium RIFCSPHIGHO2_01_FULL_49_18]|uniref:Uncharacterized protein n=1 Tax=Candidatus Chisholmbacteria bacterium RIFCSPHIGHO2_01_FULL_49_18 TaxID=1797590 RepID=A0A1G1VKZ8_9BACT|nr:MAG: hypothetical protein A2785_02580 [Candidatus Chisholmbacteria bacterium RIFCSPHIGHO2_01_FULL_49_18]
MGTFYQTRLLNAGGEFITYGSTAKAADGTYHIVEDYRFDSSNPPFRTFEDLYNTVVVSLECVEDNGLETKMLEDTFTQ